MKKKMPSSTFFVFTKRRRRWCFCNTRATVNSYDATAYIAGFSVVALSGELQPDERTHALQGDVCRGGAKILGVRGRDPPPKKKPGLCGHDGGCTAGLICQIWEWSSMRFADKSETLLHRSGGRDRQPQGVSALLFKATAASALERLLGCAKLKGEMASHPLR